jgi:HEAT repeat protein
MRSLKMGSLIAAFVAVAATMSGSDARSDTTFVGGGVGVLGDNRPADQVEFLSTPQHILSITASTSPSLIWETLEHGEKVECLECIPAVSGLLYAQDERTREIAAWWLRRRIFGVFGSGQVYENTIKTLQGDPDTLKRTYAAFALGEFLDQGGIQPLSDAITKDASPQVRAAAAAALGRMNSVGTNGALSVAMKDTDEGVRISALKAVSRVNGFTDEQTPSSLLGDSSSNVRRLAVQLLEDLHAKDTVASVMTLAQNDTDVNVRASACHALGIFQDASAKATLQNIAQNDANTFVRDAATIALRQL